MDEWKECFICMYTKKAEQFAHIGLINICKSCRDEFPYSRDRLIESVKEAEAKIAAREMSHVQP